MKIKSIKKIESSSKRYDITVANTSNYYANDILIHNCNASATYAENKLWVKSRNYFKRNGTANVKFKAPLRRPVAYTKYLFNKLVSSINNIMIVLGLVPKPASVAKSMWWEIPIRYNLEEKLKKYPYLTIYYEMVGQVRNFKYHCKSKDGYIEMDGIIFDIWDIKNKKFLEWHEVVAIANDLGMKTASVLYEGPWKTDRSLHALAEGKSTLGDHVKEGWVMRSVPESYHPKLGRKIVKLKGRDYKLAKG
jgi:hypothetical protein